MLKLLASAVTGAAALIGGIFGMHGGVGGQHATSTPPFGQHNSSSTPGEWGDHMRMGSTTPGVMGKVSAVDGTTLTVIGRGPGSAASTTYSVDASNATVMKIGTGTTTVSSIKTGDSIMVSGPLTGTNIVAKIILDGVMFMRPGMEGMHPGQNGSSTMPMRGMNPGGPMKPASS